MELNKQTQLWTSIVLDATVLSVSTKAMSNITVLFTVYIGL